MLLPRVLKIQDDELLYGWYERILQENRIEEIKARKGTAFSGRFSTPGRMRKSGERFDTTTY